MCLACQVTTRMADVEQEHHPNLEAAINGVVLREDPFAVVAAARATYQSLWTFYDGLGDNRVADRPATSSNDAGKEAT